MPEILSLDQFIEKSEELPVLDVRSPSEFRQGHIPGAVNFPLLDDDARKKVGTAYKKQGRNEAVRLGFELAGPLFHSFVTQAKKISSEQKILVHCWRGGMRSGTMVWVLELAGFKCGVLKGGYKTYRHWALNKFEEPRKILVISGKTGSGKTEVLAFLEKKNEQVIDLEGIAHHKGSAFGALGQLPQPTNEQFENELAWKWHHFDPNKIIWIESESLQVGSNLIPTLLFERMLQAPVIELKLSKENRAFRILKEYGNFPNEILAETTKKLTKRLGIQRTQEAVELLKENNKDQWVSIMLDYYDKLYLYSLSKREPQKIYSLDLSIADAEKNAGSVMSLFLEQQEKIMNEDQDFSHQILKTLG